jgi:hypothetical protein
VRARPCGAGPWYVPVAFADAFGLEWQLPGDAKLGGWTARTSGACWEIE